jgi:hypothetical protein
MFADYFGDSYFAVSFFPDTEPAPVIGDSTLYYFIAV